MLCPFFTSFLQVPHGRIYLVMRTCHDSKGLETFLKQTKEENRREYREALKQDLKQRRKMALEINSNDECKAFELGRVIKGLFTSMCVLVSFWFYLCMKP